MRSQLQKHWYIASIDYTKNINLIDLETNEVMDMSSNLDIDPNQLREALLVISSFIGIIGGIPQILRFMRKKPRLSLNDVSIFVYPHERDKTTGEHPQFRVSFKIWNGKHIYQRLRISEASSLKLKAIEITKSYRAIPISEAYGYERIIPPKSFIEHNLSFLFTENYYQMIVYITCAEGVTLKRILKIDKYLKKPNKT